MRSGPKNIEISGTGLPGRVRALRIADGLTKRDLAERAGITWRAVHDIEEGKRKRILEHTWLRLAAALDVAPAELLDSGDAADGDVVAASSRTDVRETDDSPLGPSTAVAGAGHGLGGPKVSPRSSIADVQAAAAAPVRGRTKVLISALAAIAVAIVLAPRLLDHFDQPTGIRSAGQTLIVERKLRDPLVFGPYSSSVDVQAITSWNDGRTIVYGLGPEGVDAGTVFAVDGASGRELWRVSPPREQLLKFFGEERVGDGSFRCGSLHFGDVDGDGSAELLVRCQHETWFPSYVDILRSDGTRLGCYMNWGAIYDIVCSDIDEDGKDEITLAGTNNWPDYQGATLVLLDDEHCSGGSVDSRVRPDCGVSDGSLARVVLPRFEERFWTLYGGDRLAAGNLHVSSRGEARFRCTVQSRPNAGWVVEFDHALRPLRAGASDALRDYVSKWPPELRAEFLHDYPSNWLSRYVYSGAMAEAPDGMGRMTNATR